jgi:hypothetical protein
LSARWRSGWANSHKESLHESEINSHDRRGTFDWVQWCRRTRSRHRWRTRNRRNECCPWGWFTDARNARGRQNPGKHWNGVRLFGGGIDRLDIRRRRDTARQYEQPHQRTRRGPVRNGGRVDNRQQHERMLSLMRGSLQREPFAPSIPRGRICPEATPHCKHFAI